MSNKKTTTITINVCADDNDARFNGNAYGSLVDALLEAAPGSTVHLLKNAQIDKPLTICRDVSIDLNGKVLTIESELSVKGNCTVTVYNGFLVRGRNSNCNVGVSDGAEIVLGEGLVAVCPDYFITLSNAGVIIEGAILIADGCPSPIIGDWTGGLALMRGAIISNDGSPLELGLGSGSIKSPALFAEDSAVLLGCYAEEDQDGEAV